MAKYSYEFKKKVVDAYLNGEGGYVFLANKYHVPSFNNIKNGFMLIEQMVIVDFTVQEKREIFLSIISFMW